MLTGGASSLAGVQELSTRNLLSTSENLYSRANGNEPIYATSMGLIKYAASLDDVHRIAQRVNCNGTSPSTKLLAHKVSVISDQLLLFNNHKSMNKNQLGEEQGLEREEELLFKCLLTKLR